MSKKAKVALLDEEKNGANPREGQPWGILLQSGG
jgi:hypothetical protein